MRNKIQEKESMVSTSDIVTEEAILQIITATFKDRCTI